MRMVLALALGATASLSFSYFLIVTDPEFTFKRSDNGTTFAVTLANPNGPYVPAPPVAEATPVPIPEQVPLTETAASPAAAPSAELTLLPSAGEEKTQLVEKQGFENNLAGKSVRLPTQNDVTAALGSARPARTNQAPARPGRTRTRVIYRDRPCPNEGENGWPEALRRSSR